MKILITTGSWNAPLVIMESLAQKGHEVYLLDDCQYCAGFHSKYCQEGIVCPPETDSSAYIDAMENLVSSRGFDLLIPASDRSTEFLSFYRERILPHVPMLLPSKELIELAIFKDRTYRFALGNGISIPKTYFPQSLGEVMALAREVSFPCVVKKARGTANKGNRYLNDPQELMAYYEALDTKDGWPVIQEYVQGDVYSFLGVVHQGEILDCLMCKSSPQYSLAGTAAYYCSVVDEDFLDLAKKIVKLLNWRGAINMDLIRRDNGQFCLLEINPRLSGTLAFAYQLGVDLPALYLDLARGQRAGAFAGVRYKPGVRFRFVLPTEIMFAFNHRKQFWPLFGNFLNFKIKTDIPWHDCRLLLWKLRHVWWYWQDLKKSAESDHV